MSQDNILGKVKTLQVRQLEMGRLEPQEGLAVEGVGRFPAEP